jgi:F-type H+-transporting ATPase subunit b
MVSLAFFEAIQLMPDGTLFIHIALILLMIWILNRTFFRPINKVIAARDKNKGGHSSEAESLMVQVGEKEARYTGAVREARTQGYELIEKNKAEAISAREAAIATVRDETAQQFAQEKETLARQTSEARAAIAQDAEAIADKISSRILKV